MYLMIKYVSFYIKLSGCIPGMNSVMKFFFKACSWIHFVHILYKISVTVFRINIFFLIL